MHENNGYRDEKTTKKDDFWGEKRIFLGIKNEEK